MENTLNARAEKIKATLTANEGKAPKKGVTVKEGQLTGDKIREDIGKDLKAAVKELDVLRNSAPDRKAIDISFEQYAKEKWGFSDMNSVYQCLGINPSIHSIESFTTMPEFNENFKWLIPEVIREAVRLGLRKNPVYQSLIAAEESVNQPSITLPDIKMSDAMAKKIGELETIPTGSVAFGQKKVDLTKLGYGLKVTDEVNQYVSLNVLSIFLQDVGIKLGIGLDNMAVNTLINGDQPTGDSAPVIGAQTVNVFAYLDLLRTWIRMARIGRTPAVMLSNEAPALEILELPEFKGFAGQAMVPTKIQMLTPIPTANKYAIHGAMASNNQLMIIDPTSALIKLNSSALRIESERVVEKGLSATYVTLTTGFATLFRDARVIIDKSLTFGAQPFPAYMDVSSAEGETFGE